jgi:Bacterial Ig-like domain (group 3)
MNGVLRAGGATARARAFSPAVVVLAIVVSWWLLAGVAQAAPTPGAPAPSIGGTLQVGQTLTASPGGAWTDPVASVLPITFSYAWTGANTSSSSTYLVAAGDVGKTISVTVTGTDSNGSTPVTVTTAAVPAPPANTVAPTITGTAQVGQQLTANPGTWTGATTFSYIWTGTGTAVGATYTVAPTDLGKTISVAVSASGPGGAGGPISSAPTAAVLPLPPAAASGPTISGTPQQGQGLTLTHAPWTSATAITAIADQWEQCDVFGIVCTPIPGQTGTTYTLGPGDVGHMIAVAESASNAGGPSAAVASSPSAPATATSATSVLAYSAAAPKTNQTVTLIATISSSSGNASPSGSVTFFNGSAAIGGCSGKAVNGGTTVTVICPAGFAAGTAQISAAYQPGPGSLVAGSTSTPTAITIGRDSTAVSLAVTQKVNVGKNATYSATLVLPVSNSGPIQATGSVAFLDGGQPIPGCASQPLSNLGATCTQSYNSKRTHQISAVYSGDANFAGSTSSTSSVQIVKSGAKAVAGFVKSLLLWSFFYHPTYTSVMKFSVSPLAKGTTIIISCQGNGCAFAQLQLTPRHARSINLLSRFDRRKLKPGTKVTVRVTHTNWVGKYFSFTIRAGAPPVVAQKCIAVGRTVPGRGC